MKKKTIIKIAIAVTFIIVGYIAISNNYINYIYLLLSDADKYPTGKTLDNMVVYKFDPETILQSLDQGDTDVFMTALKNPIYDSVPPLDPQSSFSWNQEDFLKVANNLHQFVWKQSLDEWHLYSADVVIPQCNDLSRYSSAGFQYYNRQEDWYFEIHNMNIDLEYGFVYAGDNNDYYTGQWKDINLDIVTVNNSAKALMIAEENGGQETRMAMDVEKKCHILISISPHSIYNRSWFGWGWEVTYWGNEGASLAYGITIDPYSGKYEVIK